MYPRSARFDAAIRAGGTIACRVDVYDTAGTLIQSDLPFGPQTVVTVDASSPGVRRTLTLEVPPGASFETLLEPSAAILKAYRGVRYIDRSTELLPLGVFEIDTEDTGYTPATVVAQSADTVLTCPDLWARVQRTRFEAPVITNGPNIAQALGLMTGACTTAPSIAVNTATSTLAKVQAVWPRDRDQAILSLLAAAGAEAFFDADGNIVCRDLPIVSDYYAWSVDVGLSGVLTDADRKRTRATTYNVIVVAAVMANGAELFDPVTVEDDDPTSLTYVGTYGRSPYFVSTATVTTVGQATAYGQSILTIAKANAAQLTLSAVPHPGLEAGDTIQVVLPDGTVERHLVQTFTIPLTTDSTSTATQTITTVSSRPDGDLPAEDS